MTRLLVLVLMLAQVRTSAPVDTAFYTVSYTEVMPSAKAATLAAFREYRAASRSQDGYVRFELFERVGRPGHLCLIETWRDQKAFEARDTAVQTRLMTALQPVRLSDYDQRPYKTLSVAVPTAASGRETIYVITHVDVSPGPQVPLLLQRLAQSSRQEAGNGRFDVLQHNMRANHFTVIESWRNQTALEAHAAAAHTRQYRDELGPALGSPLDERIYEAIE